MGIKELMQKRVERGAVKSVIEGKEVILKKSKIPIIGGEWREIHPPIDENGRWNIFNAIFGGWRNFVRLLIIMLLLSYGYYTFSDILGNSKEYMNGNKYVIMEKPLFYKYCQGISEQEANLNFNGSIQNIEPGGE